jgi:hypothetical protein
MQNVDQYYKLVSLLCMALIFFRNSQPQNPVLMIRVCFSFLLFSLVLFSGITVLAQPRSAKQARQFTERMNESLKLSPEQYKKVLEINQAAAQRAKTVIQQTTDNRTLRRKLSDISSEIDIALLEILSTFQWRDWMDLSNELNAENEQPGNSRNL